jgi:Flp pilus assembly protein CpaB
MKRGSRILLFLVIAIVILIAVAFLVLGRGGASLFGAPAPTSTPPAVSIVIVGQPINRDDQIKKEALSAMQIPQSGLTDKMITDPQAVIGKYALFPLAQGLPLTADMLSDRPGMNQPGSEAAKVVSPGLVAITLMIENAPDLVAYGIRDGDRVNVIATTKFLDVDASFQSKLPNYTAIVTGTGFVPDTLPVLSAKIEGGTITSQVGRAELDPTNNQALYLVPSEGQRPRLVSQMILQDIQVLHMGEFSLPAQDAQKQAASDAAAAPPANGQPAPTAVPVIFPKYITLIVTPQDAVALTYLMNSNTKFTLVLRAPDDTSRVETEAATLQYLLSQYAIPVPAKLPYVMDMSVPTPTPAP